LRIKRETPSFHNPKKESASPDPGGWTHVNSEGRSRMVDVSPKKVTLREAWAAGTVLLKKETLKRIENNSLEKGDVLSVAKISGIMAAKKTPELIPMCHPIQVSGIDLSFSLAKNPPRVDILAKVQARDRTGVEMEAMTAVAAAALTIYDMCKAVDRGIRITELCLIKKTGGKSGVFRRPEFFPNKKSVKE
jgi:cyclic pyranopterin monophosphate synthase